MTHSPAVGALKTEIKVPSGQNAEQSKVLPLKPGVGRNKATHALSTGRNFFLIF